MVVVFLVSFVTGSEPQTVWNLWAENPVSRLKAIDDGAPLFLFGGNVTFGAEDPLPERSLNNSRNARVFVAAKWQKISLLRHLAKHVKRQE